MSELFDKEVNAQKESFKKTSRVHASSRKPTKVCDENETIDYIRYDETKKQEKKRGAPKIFFDGRKFIRRMRKLLPWISNDFRSLILHTLKVLFAILKCCLCRKVWAELCRLKP